MNYVHNVHPDGLTYTILATFAAFWIEEAIQMYRHGTTVSQLLGWFERESVTRHILVAILPFVLLLHLAFFP